MAVITEKDLPITIHYNMINLKAEKTSFQFLYFLLKSANFQNVYLSKARQSVQEYLAIEDVESILIKLPLNDPIFKEKEIVFIGYYEKIKSNQMQINILQKLRDMLLPKLMSGEVRMDI